MKVEEHTPTPKRMALSPMIPFSSMMTGVVPLLALHLLMSLVRASSFDATTLPFKAVLRIDNITVGSVSLGYDAATTSLFVSFNASSSDLVSGKAVSVGLGAPLTTSFDWISARADSNVSTCICHENGVLSTGGNVTYKLYTKSDWRVLDGTVQFGAGWMGASFIITPLPASLRASMQVLFALGALDHYTSSGGVCCSTVAVKGVRNTTAIAARPSSSLMSWHATGACNHGIAANSTACSDCLWGYVGATCAQSCPCVAGECVNPVTFNLATCSRCYSSYYGPNCSSQCRCQNGTCSEGPQGTGSCSCFAGFAGTLCDACDATHFGSNCSKSCTCRNGDCSNANMGSGRCLSCVTGYAGLNCDVACAICNASSVCDGGIWGTGACIARPTTVVYTTTSVIVSTTSSYGVISQVLVVVNQTASSMNVTRFVVVVSRALGISADSIAITLLAPGDAGTTTVGFRLNNLGSSTSTYYNTFFAVGGRKSAVHSRAQYSHSDCNILLLDRGSVDNGCNDCATP